MLSFSFVGLALYDKKKQYEKAIADCTEAIRLKPDFAAAYDHRASVAFQKGDFTTAISDASEAIRLDPLNAAFYETRSLAYEKKGDLEKWGEDYQTAKQLHHNGVISDKNQEDASLEIVRTDAGELVFANPLVSKYVPSIDNGNGSHRFSEAQLKQMAKTPLDQGLFLRYVEAKWPIGRLKAFCTREHRWPPGMQNLVPDNLCFNEWEIPIHKANATGSTRFTSM